MDVLSPEQRRLNMSRIRGANTNPELRVRRALHAAGLRYRLHVRDLPGTPDLVLPRWRAAVFVHGCFWHGHACPAFRLPATRAAFWQEKIAANRLRDERQCGELLAKGWRVATIWECAVRGPRRRGPDEVATLMREFLEGDAYRFEIGQR
jgi:DNA mismatch endonuclease (patch repair protein)